MFGETEVVVTSCCEPAGRTKGDGVSRSPSVATSDPIAYPILAVEVESSAMMMMPEPDFKA